MTCSHRAPRVNLDMEQSFAVDPQAGASAGVDPGLHESLKKTRVNRDNRNLKHLHSYTLLSSISNPPKITPSYSDHNTILFNSPTSLLPKIIKWLQSVVKMPNESKASVNKLLQLHILLISQLPAIRKSIHSIMLLPIPFPTPSSNTLAIYKRKMLWLDLETGPRFSMIIQNDKRIICPYQHGRNPSQHLRIILPVLILPQSELSSSIQSQSIWVGKLLENLLDEILNDTQAMIAVQDQTKPDLNQFTLTKTCKEVRDRFDIRPEDRGCPCNCLEIRDRLSGFNGPRPPERVGDLWHLQMTNPDETTMNRYAYTPLPGAKAIDRWLLVSENLSGSTSHVDVGFATWVSCLAGKKTFWVRNPSTEDQQVWKDFDIDDDRRFLRKITTSGSFRWDSE